jgi:hypothetical protein
MLRSAWLGFVAPALLALVLVRCAESSPSAPAPADVPLPPRGDADTDPSDAAVAPGDGGPDAGPPACDTTKPFGAAVRVADFEALAHRASPHLSADELTIYFTTTSPANSSELTMAVRPSKSAPFAGETVLPQSTVNSENDPTVGADDLSLWFFSLRNGSADLFFATRTSPMMPFGVATAVPVVNGGTTIEATPYFRTAGSELWFVSERADSALLDVYLSKRVDGAFGVPTRVVELSSAGDEFAPQPSEDGLTLILGSDRAGGKGKEDLWISRRASVAVPFDAPTPLTEINSSSGDQPGWLSADGCRIWFSSGRETADDHQQIFFAERPRP